MKRLQILGLYKPAAEANAYFRGRSRGGFAVESSDGLVEMTATRGSARRTARRTSRRNP
jgi:hypothetical protein